MKTKLKKGQLAWCWYPNHLKNDEIDLFYCRIVEMRDEYSTVKIYYGEEYDPKKIRGVFDDVCTADIEELSKEELIECLKIETLQDIYY